LENGDLRSPEFFGHDASLIADFTHRLGPCIYKCHLRNPEAVAELFRGERAFKRQLSELLGAEREIISDAVSAPLNRTEAELKSLMKKARKMNHAESPIK
jgi:hypothetical protein